jgi:transposase
VYDSVTGDVTKAYVFIAVLPCSCFAYAQACGDMWTENWLVCHIHAYNYFGGVTRLLIPDNLKTGVTANTRYETVLNRSYLELSEHYGTAVVLPASGIHKTEPGRRNCQVCLDLDHAACVTGNSSLWPKCRKL